jgi:hypothetical protein
MAHKNILMGLSGGQLFTLDHRLVHPRRPVAAPTKGEMEEGLVQYNPFIPIIPVNAVTLDTRIAGEAVRVVTASGTTFLLFFDKIFHCNLFLILFFISFFILFSLFFFAAFSSAL